MQRWLEGKGKIPSLEHWKRYSWLCSAMVGTDDEFLLRSFKNSIYLCFISCMPGLQAVPEAEGRLPQHISGGAIDVQGLH